MTLATKHRPRSFEDVVGQAHIKTILQNQVSQGSIRNAYLFTGGAGTGKTTTARIFARAINGDKGTPIEVDAASNNGVDHVRVLREECQFKPLDTLYKVYIIDEVHMLSTAAFNALLKTLEEPPAHAVFILCTTDPQKIPATILSRVQRFDFRRMTTQQIIDRLSYILRAENHDEVPDNSIDAYDVSLEAIEYIAKLANGGMRDAISLLDTCLSYKGTLDAADISEILGTTPLDVYLRLLTAIAAERDAEVFEIIEQQHLLGRDIKALVRGLTEFTVELMKLQTFDDIDLVQTSIPSVYMDDVAEAVRLLTGTKSLPILFVRLNKLYHSIKYETHPKALVQGVLVTLWEQ